MFSLVLGSRAGNGPPLLIEIDLTPGHSHNLTAALRGQETQLVHVANRGSDAVERHPDFLDFSVGEISRALLFLAGSFEANTWSRFEDSRLDGPIVDSTDASENAIGHDGCVGCNRL